MTQKNAEVIRTVKNAGSAEPERAEKRKLRVAAYCRVSTLSEEQEESFETQKAAYEAIIDKNPDMELAGIYADRGVSGGDIKKRKQFLKMMQDCRDGKIDMIMTKSISRFARNLADTLECIRELKGLGIPVRFDREGIDTMNPSGDMLLGMLAAVAQEEINSMSRNIKWAQLKSWEKGNPKHFASYGYRVYMVGDVCLWGICEPEAERIRLAFEMAEKGERYWKIVCALQEMEEREKTGIVWDQVRLRRYLTDRAYIGDRITGKTVCVDCFHKKTVRNNGKYPKYYMEGHHEPLVSKERFERVGENIKSGVMKAPPNEERPERCRSAEWKKKNGLKEVNNNKEIYEQSRGCCTEKGKGALKDGEKCVYGRCKCYGCTKSDK
ncbi:MAG: recombinase family protein [Clostridia bacterium]|nr:recombinase family protein [Clostridia bacterium]